MKTSPPDDRQELEELRRLLRSDGLRIPEGLRSEQIVQKLREGASPTSVSRRNLLRPLLVTAAAAVVVCLLILPVWENMSQSTDLLWPQHTAAPEQTADAQNAAGSTTSPDNGTAGTTDEHTLLGTSGKGGGNLTLDGTSGTTSTVGLTANRLDSRIAFRLQRRRKRSRRCPTTMRNRISKAGPCSSICARRRPIWKITRMKRSICHSPHWEMRFRRWLIPGKPCSSSLPTHKAVPLSRKFSGDWAIPGYMN